MGNAASGGFNVSPEELQALLVETGLEKSTLISLADVFASPAARRLAAQPKPGTPSPFARLTQRRKGSVATTEQQQQSLAEVEMPLASFAKMLEQANICKGEAALRMAHLFDSDGSKTISLREFLVSMSVLLKGDPRDKLAFVFKTYDLDGSGSLTVEEVELLSAQMMSTYHSKGISAAGIEAEQVVSGFLRSLDSNGDGIITEEEFVTEGLKNPKLLPLLVSHNWELGDDTSRGYALLQAARQGKVDRVKLLLKEVPVDFMGDSGETALYLAARKHLNVAELLLDAGANPNVSTYHGQTPMHRAVLSGLTDMVDLLVKHKAVVEVANPLDGWTPFHTAVSTGNIAMIKHLLRLKANPKALTTSGLSSLHIAVSHDHAQVVPLLVSSFECDVPVNGRAEFERKFTALHFACQSCHLASLRALLDSKASIDEVDSAGVTPLGMLCRRSESHPQLEECGKLLLANHASPTVTTALGNTPLHLAAMANNVIMCHLLALSNKELMSAKNGEGKTPLQVAQREAQLGLQKDHISDLPDNTRKLLDACRQNDVAKLRDAISKGGDANADDGSGNTALYYAILNKSVEGAVALLQAGALVDKQNERGSPLHVAVMTGIVPLVTALLDKKADAHAADPQWGMRAIHTAAFFGKPEVIRLLIARRCSDANESSEGGKRPLHWAAQRGQLESLNVLLEMGADKEALTDDGLTPLHVAAAHGRAAIVTRLLEAGANPRVLASDQRTVLHFAAQEGDGATIGALVKAVPELVMAKTVGNDTMLHRLCLGGSVGALAHLQGHGPELMSCVNEFGQTPLHLACRHASVQFVTVLLALHENVNVNAEDKDGVMPIYYASAAHKEDVIQLLKSKGAYFREEKIVSDAIRFEPSTSFPKIESASIDALIDYLILTCDKIDDTVFRENFFLAYRQLIKPAELLQKLIQYCKNATPEEEANSFVPNMRVSTQVPMPAVARAPVDSKLARRRSLTGREKKVGLRSSLTQIPQLSSSPPPAESAIAQPLPPVAAPVAAPYVLLPQNPLRRSVVIRVIRRWVMHSPMDFDSRAAGVGKVKRELSRTRSLNKTFTNSRHQMVKEGTFILPRSFPMLRGTMPEENASMLDQFVLSIDPKDDNELMAELTLLDKALCPPDEEVHERPPGAALSLTTSTSSTPTFAPSPMTQKLVGRIGRPSLVEANKPKSSFLDWSAEAAAQQLTFMSKRLWDALSLWEFYDVAFTRKEKDELCPNINALIRHINRVGDWAKSLVLSSDDAKKRGAAISFIIAVMDACLRMRNFSDVMGLSTALQSTSLERLAKSWRFVTEESNTLLKQVKDAMDPRGNYKNLRKLMEEKSGEPTILFVGLTMGDLIHADEVTKKIEGRHNWYKYELLARLLSVIPKYQRLKYTGFEEDRAFHSMFEKSEFLDAEQYLLYPKQKDDFCLVRVSDGDFYVTAKLTARAIALLEQQDLSATQIKGACVSLRKFDKVTSPSKLEVQLVCDDVMHLGADGSTPFYSPKDVNQAPALRAALDGAKNEDDFMLLMAEVVDQDQPSRTAYGEFPFTTAEAVIPPAQRKKLKALPGWTSAEVGGESPSESEPEYFQEGIGTQIPVNRDSASSQPSDNDDGVYVIVDGVRKQPALSPDVGPARSAAPLTPSVSLSPGLGDASQMAGEEPAVVMKPRSQANPKTQDKENPNSRSRSPARSPSKSPKSSSQSLSFDFADRSAKQTPSKIPSLKQTPPKVSSSSPAGAKRVAEAPPSQQVEAESPNGAGVDMSEEALPPFKPPSLPDSVAAADLPQKPREPSQLEWPADSVAALCAGVRQFGTDWPLVAASMASVGCLSVAPGKVEKFFLQYQSLLPDLRAALEEFDKLEPKKKRPKKAELEEDEGVYEVEAILEERDGDSGREFLVKWKGWDVQDATWIEESSFVHCDDMMKQWNESKARAAKDAAQLKVPSPPKTGVARRVEFGNEFDVPDSPPSSASKRVRDPEAAPEKTGRWRPSADITKRPKKKVAVGARSRSEDSLSSRLALKVLDSKMV